MTDCTKHGTVMVSKQVDTDKWEDTCPVCEHQEWVKLKARVEAMWLRLGMPVEAYTHGDTIGGFPVG